MKAYAKGPGWYRSMQDALTCLSWRDTFHRISERSGHPKMEDGRRHLHDRTKEEGCGGSETSSGVWKPSARRHCSSSPPNGAHWATLKAPCQPPSMTSKPPRPSSRPAFRKRRAEPPRPRCHPQLRHPTSPSPCHPHLRRRPPWRLLLRFLGYPKYLDGAHDDRIWEGERPHRTGLGACLSAFGFNVRILLSAFYIRRRHNLMERRQFLAADGGRAGWIRLRRDVGRAGSGGPRVLDMWALKRDDTVSGYGIPNACPYDEDSGERGVRGRVLCVRVRGAIRLGGREGDKGIADTQRALGVESFGIILPQRYIRQLLRDGLFQMRVCEICALLLQQNLSAGPLQTALEIRTRASESRSSKDQEDTDREDTDKEEIDKEEIDRIVHEKAHEAALAAKIKDSGLNLQQTLERLGGVARRMHDMPLVQEIRMISRARDFLERMAQHPQARQERRLTMHADVIQLFNNIGIEKTPTTLDDVRASLTYANKVLDHYKKEQARRCQALKRRQEDLQRQISEVEQELRSLSLEERDARIELRKLESKLPK
ncbi:unnamed protein product [Vitrella brassicaformis CCMP3155]|uniref:Uncharacterized protein n=1 Tax=Vitrella brassicaformis (strain CCMP3155) TaxID=1169540 RepID=A0A0G4E9W6_VITBC|nr:unnamed protein product [Vitrella brassicaformis CCMP3155]|eukprot:CEL91985.1 unnamed protein product [Vitrella brassicaformis CCMP3155]